MFKSNNNNIQINNDNINNYISKKVKKTKDDNDRTTSKKCKCTTSMCSTRCGCKKSGKDCSKFCDCFGKCNGTDKITTNDNAIKEFNNVVNCNDTSYNVGTTEFTHYIKQQQQLLPQQEEEQPKSFVPYKHIHIPFENIPIERTDPIEMYYYSNNQPVVTNCFTLLINN